jgi:hypothetical protein
LFAPLEQGVIDGMIGAQLLYQSVQVPSALSSNVIGHVV